MAPFEATVSRPAVKVRGSKREKTLKRIRKGPDSTLLLSPLSNCSLTALNSALVDFVLRFNTCKYFQSRWL